MTALLRMCAKVAYLSFRKQAALSLLLVMALAVVVPLDLAVFYAVLLWLMLGHVLALRVKEKKEGWNHLLLSLAGYDRRFPSYLYVFLILLALLTLGCGTGLNWIAQQQDWVDLRPASFTALAATTAGVLFFYQCLLLISELIPYENLIPMQKVSFFVLVFAAKAMMDRNPATFLAMLPWISGAMAAFSLAPVCLVATYLYRRRNHLA